MVVVEVVVVGAEATCRCMSGSVSHVELHSLAFNAQTGR